jgi:flagellar biosynthesis protein FlhA
MGIVLPPIGVRDDLACKPSQYSVVLSGAVVAQAEVFPERLMAIPSPIPTASSTAFPASSRPTACR